MIDILITVIVCYVNTLSLYAVRNQRIAAPLVLVFFGATHQYDYSCHANSYNSLSH